ncbi:hypothetical protein [Adhaeribacter radiodurans]|uniref:Uncharacterized protein n=1 Tax=Adhaeribacter radiodurans TaxID=2745197 RepID=A0A7L7LBI9_9BACT|nr:hypothetical protein [Adhaeribacter radiodurans]QMU30202.1 hypothetical protein HUW48_20170 [Adhaeribacter radiodurans]
MVISSANYSRIFIFLFLFSFVILSGCNSGKIPCPEPGGGRKFTIFRKKADTANPGQEGFGQSKLVGYDKNGLMKKKSYKGLKQKPKRLKSV